MRVDGKCLLNGLKIKFLNGRTVKILSLLSDKGKSCVAYNGEIISHDCNGNKHIEKCIIKEFAPAGFTRNTEVNGENDYFISRVLPAQKSDFFKIFHQFKSDMDKIRWNILDKINEDSSLRNYVVNIPDEENQVFEFNEDEGSYKGIMLFPYESSDAAEKIKNLSISERLNVLVQLCKIIDKFHQQNMILIDLKPDNFIYYNDGINCYIKLFDFDSVATLDENGLLNNDKLFGGTPFFSSPEVLEHTERVDKNSDVYSVGAMLFYFITIDVFDKLIPNPKYFSISKLKKILNNDTFKAVKENEQELTLGFWNRFVSIIKSSMNEVQGKRTFGSENSPMIALAKEIEILKDIYEHKGVHPEVMLDRAIALSNNKNFFDEDVFVEELLCEIEEVN